MPTSNLTILRTYALKEPTALPKSILFTHTESSLAIHDGFPKSMFHFLLLPRIIPPLEANELNSLKTLLNSDRAHAKQVISALNEDAKSVRKDIEEEMVKRYGFKWEIWIGFHAMTRLEPKLYEALLKEDIACFHCGSTMKNLPALKSHLQDEWEMISAREKAKIKKKRKMELSAIDVIQGPDNKKTRA
ncbi:hypothetical protein H0H81_001145 [Sphagnurus paluster]|uniref:Aprataxin C2HE/C2H2/C2HC zinc finger domain-containing protein n=1 Tax=Sphagnurus paluster TaxID=117069 RepID=A0A9P7GPN2_9AGAR|nr:hypothetical protein H0H81_001145 [Sphagnurus paluster]